MKTFLNNLSQGWQRLFLEDRPTIGLSFFRIGVAITVGCHVLPTFLPLKENYLSGAFKVLNSQFFTTEFLQWIQQSPDSLVVAMTVAFCIVWFCFLVGLWSQVSCILMTLGCYYFYALNAYPIATLSWDILLVTLVLLCLSPGIGDYFAIDCLLKRDPQAYTRERPFYIQRLLQMQLAFTYFYTGLYKITAKGNWVTDNPIYYLMQYPPEGVTKYFLIRDVMAHHPQFCYGVGLLVVGCELLMPFLLFCRATRTSAIILGFVFHLTLILTLDVPAIFFFLYPAQLLLFINPREIIAWIDRRRAFYVKAPQNIVIYDGNCQFCTASVQILKVMDLYSRLTFINFHEAGDLKLFHPQLTIDQARSQMIFIAADGTKWGGFGAFRKLSWLLPMMWPGMIFLYAPGAGIVGPWLYRIIAKNRYFYHLNKTCENNACFR